MTTSNTTSFTINDQECIRQAFEKIQILGEGDQLAAFDYNVAKNTLNLMIKAWQMQDNHLWVKQTATMFFQKSQNTYEISATTSDHFTVDSIITTTLSTSNLSGVTTLTVVSTAGMTNGDFIGVVQSDNTIHWSTILLVVGSTTININNATTTTTISGANVYSYTNQLTTPFQVYAITRKYIISNIDVPLNMMSYREYFDQPNKLSQGVPTMWAYDRQLDRYIIRLWPTPADTQYYGNLILARKIQDMDATSDNFDIPQEWGETVVLNLAIRLAPTYGKAQGENFAELKMQAADSLNKALNFDNELGSLYIAPSGDGFRRP